VSILHYVYDVRFFGADAAPVLLGLAVVANRFVGLTDLDRGRLLLLRITLPLAAILVSLNMPSLLNFAILDRNISTLEFATLGAYLAYVYFFLLRHASYYVAVAGLTVLARLFGPTPSQTVHFTDRSLRWIILWLERLIPRTSTEWGVVGLAAAFAFLILGFAISLLKRPMEAVPVSAGPPTEEHFKVT
jgi:hypothetical protein